MTFVPRPRAPTAEGAYRNAKAIEVYGVTYVSIAAASRALGVSRATLRKTWTPPERDPGRDFEVGPLALLMLAASAKKPEAPKPRRKRVGRFGSIKAAADSIGASPACVSKRIAKGQNPLRKVRQVPEKYTKAIPSSAPKVENEASRSSPLKSIGERIPGGQSGENR